MKKNIVLLAMSVYGGRLQHNDFCIKETGEVVAEDCDGQLEPVIKMALKEFPGQKLEIIMLCTDETLNNPSQVTGKTSVEYFKERVQGFSQTAEVSFKEIPLDEDKPQDAIFKAVLYIRTIQSEIRTFWIDTHGGFRDVVLMMEAIVSLLKVEDIKPDRIWGVQFADKGRKYIVDQSEAYALFDFVAGMNEFISYGSVRMLNQYYLSHPQTETEKNLLDAMKQVSDGLQDSDPEKYLNGLDLLGDMIGCINEHNTFMLIFREYLERSYGDLLDPEKRTVTGIIRRCLEKGFIMQALTFIEALMPKEFVDHHIIEFNSEEVGIIKNNKQKNYKIDNWKSDENFVVDRYVTSKYNNYFSTNGKAADLLNYIEAELDRKATDTSKPKETFFQKKKGQFCSSIKLCLVRDQKNSEINLHTAVQEKDEKKAGRIMRLHKALKECRNKIVHCNSERPDTDSVKRLIDLYLEKTEALFSIYPKTTG